MNEFKDKVIELTNQMVQEDDGNWALPEEVAKDLDESTMYAITLERRRRDTQAGYTKVNQKLKQEQAVNTGLQERLLSSEVILTKEQKFELDELKKTNPDAWREKLNEYEEANKTLLQTELTEIRTKGSDKGEVEIRKEQMAAWAESTGIELDDDVIANDLPPRFLKKLDSGEFTFEEFLTEAGKFLKTGKVIKGADEGSEDGTTDLSRISGGQEPSKTAQEGDFDETYKDQIF